MIKKKIKLIHQTLNNDVTLVVVSKNRSLPMLMEVYKTGYRVFGENKVQEMVEKYHALPKDIFWHMIGHLQTNKVKYIAPFVSLIHGVDSLKLLNEINKRANQNSRVIDCLLQIDISKEKTKFGLTRVKAKDILFQSKEMSNIRIKGLMGMASNTNNVKIIKREFSVLHNLFENLKQKSENFDILSMGMSRDYQLAIEEGSNMIRLGSAIFG